MSDRDDLTDLHGDRIATTEARLEGFYWVILGHVATKADVQNAEARLNTQVAGVRADLALVDTGANQTGRPDGGGSVALFAALHYLPPPHG